MPTGLFVGLSTLDVIQVVDGLPAANQKVTAMHSWLAAGGPAAVAAIAFAALGGHARLLTVLGAGAAAEVVRSDLTAAGVDVSDAAPSGFELAASVALVDSRTGERAVVSGSGHRPSSLVTEAWGDVAADVVLVDGHHPELAVLAARAAAKTGTPVVMDAGSYKPVFDDLWNSTTDVICSADYVDPAGMKPRDLLARGPRLVAVSHGGEPLRWWTERAAGELPVPRADAVDTLSAGDVLHGAYCFALGAGSNRTDALSFATRAASTKVGHLGPFAWRPAVGGMASELP